MAALASSSRALLPSSRHGSSSSHSSVSSSSSSTRARTCTNAALRPQQRCAPHRATFTARHSSSSSRCISSSTRSRAGALPFDPLMVVRQRPAGRRAPACTPAASSEVAVAEEEAPQGAMKAFVAVSDFITNLFPVWTVIAALVGLFQPSAFDFISVKFFTVGLSLLMFSMGITLTINDFVRVFQKPGVVGLGFLACYAVMPLLAYALAMAFNLPPALLAGLVLVGSINGGQASNLCTYIAKGDVALSVLMTTSTTIGTIFMTPLIAKIVLGTIVPVDAAGIAMSTVQVVLAPIIVGVTANKFAPKACKAVEPFCPIIGIISTVLLVGASVAKCAGPIIDAGIMLQIPVILLHLLGGVLGYWMNKLVGYNEKTCRTTAIETAMKSSAFGFLLASMHFGDFLVRVPSAVSVVWMAVMGSSMAVFWRFIPIKEESKTSTA